MNFFGCAFIMAFRVRNLEIRRKISYSFDLIRTYDLLREPFHRPDHKLTAERFFVFLQSSVELK